MFRMVIFHIEYETKQNWIERRVLIPVLKYLINIPNEILLKPLEAKNKKTGGDVVF